MQKLLVMVMAVVVAIVLTVGTSSVSDWCFGATVDGVCQGGPGIF